MRKSYAFVVPRFGEGIAGGAETLVGSVARAISERGDKVHILTTCAKDNRTWENAYPAGDAVEYGVRVTRFPVDDRDLERWIPLQIRISRAEQLTVEEQLDWITNSVNSKELYNWIKENHQSYDLLFFAPYLFGTTFFGSLVAPEKSVLIPCLHDESYAYLDIIASMFRQVRGCMFNAAPEMDLANSIYGPIDGLVVGMGFNAPSSTVLPPYFSDKAPYLLYLGRKETGKNAHLLIEHFMRSKDLNMIPQDLKLVILGGGDFSDLNVPKALKRQDVVDLPHLSEEDKRRVVQNALCLCQPSVNESFSIVIMEAWQEHVPVLVHGECAVTRHHVTESSGGLWFSNQEDFAGVVSELSKNHELRLRLAKSGNQYVANEYAWPAVCNRFDKLVKQLELKGSKQPIKVEQHLDS